MHGQRDRGATVETKREQTTSPLGSLDFKIIPLHDRDSNPGPLDLESSILSLDYGDGFRDLASF